MIGSDGHVIPVLLPAPQCIQVPGAQRSRTLPIAGLLVFQAAVFGMFLPAQTQSSAPKAQIEGRVRDGADKPIAGVSISLRVSNGSPLFAKSDANGEFTFGAVAPGSYMLRAESTGFEGFVDDNVKVSDGEKKRCEFSLRPQTASGFQLDDRPSFTVSGVTDSTSSGGHGSETRMRAGEALARETVNLGSGSRPTVVGKGAAPGTAPDGAIEDSLRHAVAGDPASFEANHRLGEFYLAAGKFHDAVLPLQTAYDAKPGDQANAFDLAVALKGSGEFDRAKAHANKVLGRPERLDPRDESNLHRLLGDLNEHTADSLDAEHEYERAAALDPSEQNYFAWGAELLLHRAIAPATEVFAKGTRLHPGSARMLSGLGAALYASGAVEDAAKRVCQAADLDAGNSAPYLFLGKMQEASSAPLPCAEEKLAGFARTEPANAAADYYYGLVLWKQSREAADAEKARRAETFLSMAFSLDPALDTAALQLGNVYFARGAIAEAISTYQKAIAANPNGSDSHYRLGLAYRRAGEEDKAQAEFEIYKQLEKNESAEVDKERKEIQQFVVVLKEQPSGTSSAPGPFSPPDTK